MKYVNHLEDWHKLENQYFPDDHGIMLQIQAWVKNSIKINQGFSWNRVGEAIHRFQILCCN